MEEDDDDLYDPADSFPPQQEHNYNQTTEDTKPGDSYELEEEEEDDDDVNCTSPGRLCASTS